MAERLARPELAEGRDVPTRNRKQVARLWPVAECTEQHCADTGRRVRARCDWHRVALARAETQQNITPLAALRQAENNIAAWYEKANGSGIVDWRAFAVCRQN